MFFSLVARAPTLGNSCNLHKSKMAAMDPEWDTIIQLVNSESRVIHLYNIICTWGIDFWRQFCDWRSASRSKVKLNIMSDQKSNT